MAAHREVTGHDEVMSENPFDLAGKVALVTGTSRGLGQYFGRALARAGADLVITSRHSATLEPFQVEIEGLGRRALPLGPGRAQPGEHPKGGPGRPGALRQDRHPGEQRRLQRAQTGPRCDLGGLEPGAGHEPARDFLRGPGRRPPHDCAPLRTHHQYRLRNQRLRLRRSRALLRQPRRSQTAHDEPGRRLGLHGITVNCLAPGWFKTPQNAVLYEDKEWVEYLCDRIPLKRPGQPLDLDGAIVFLASDASAYITGQTLLVDGGVTTGATRATVSRK